MLDLMRKHAGSWMIKIILFAIVVVFVFWGVGSFRSRKATQVAEVNGEIISYDTYRQAYYKLIDQYRRLYGSQLNDDMLKMLRPSEQALDQLINRMLMLQEAGRLKIQITDQAVADIIRQNSIFQNTGTFDYERYRRILAQNNITTDEFEAGIKEDLRIDQVQALVMNGVIVSESEAREWYDWFNAEVNLTYVHFSPDRYQDITPSEEEVGSYFKEHENDYRTEPQVKVRYLYFNPDSYKAQVNVTEEEIAQYYAGHPDEFKTEKTVEARHILLKLDSDADAQAVADQKKKALEIYEMAKSGKDFAELAKQYSQGPTREKGGYLGAFKRDAMVKPFADKAFSMQPGEISEPVRTQYGWHIIKIEKVNAAATQSLEAVTDRIRDKLADEKAHALALEKAESVYDTVFDGDDLMAVGQNVQVPVQTTDFFTRNGPQQKGIGNPRQFADTAFGLTKMAVSEIQDLGDGYYLLQAVDQIEASIPPLETVADKVKADVIKARQDERAKADAQAFLADLQKAEAMSDISTRYKVNPIETGFFKRTGTIPKIGYESQINEAAFQLSGQNALFEQPVKGKQGWYVIRLKERKQPNDDQFAKEKASLAKRLTDQKKQAAFQRWMADLKARSAIDVNRELIQ